MLFTLSLSGGGTYPNMRSSTLRLMKKTWGEPVSRSLAQAKRATVFA